MVEYIDRQAVRLIESDPDAYPQKWNDDYEKGFTDALNKVITLPSAQPEPQTGRWIETEDGDLQCSECGHITGELIDVYEPLKADLPSKYGITIPKGSSCWALKHPYFCAKCGADMRGGGSCDGGD